VLSPRICGEGMADWMLNVSTLQSLPFPEPLTFNSSKVFPPDPASGSWQNWNPAVDCMALGPLAFLGWSEFYATDAAGKAFQQIYTAGTYLASIVDVYWQTVARAFRSHAGVLAYELLNEPWSDPTSLCAVRLPPPRVGPRHSRPRVPLRVGDAVQFPELLLRPGEAEVQAVGPYMQRIHDVIRKEDALTPTMFAPAEINDRLMRHVGYQVRRDGHSRCKALSVTCPCLE
jgi:hypothetical protein